MPTSDYKGFKYCKIVIVVINIFKIIIIIIVMVVIIIIFYLYISVFFRSIVQFFCRSKLIKLWMNLRDAIREILSCNYCLSKTGQPSRQNKQFCSAFLITQTHILSEWFFGMRMGLRSKILCERHRGESVVKQLKWVLS